MDQIKIQILKSRTYCTTINRNLLHKNLRSTSIKTKLYTKSQPDIAKQVGEIKVRKTMKFQYI